MSGSVFMLSSKKIFCLLWFLFLFAQTLTAGYSPAMPPELPEALRIVDVHNDTELADAIGDLKAGDRVVLHDGEYGGILLEDINVGTAEHPVVFTAANRRQAVVRGYVNSRNLKVSNCSYMHFYSLRFTNARTWGVVFGPAYSSDTQTKGCHYMRIQDCEIDSARQELLKINGNSSFIEVLNNELHHSGLGLNGKSYAEGIYVGEGSTKIDRTHDVLIQGNHIHHIGRCGDKTGFGEAIDLKTKCYNITVLDNLIEHVTVNSQAAITVHLNDAQFPAGFENPNILISRNIIHDVRKSDEGWDGCGIWVGSNGVTISNNIIWNTLKESIKSSQDAGNTGDSLRIYNNTCFNVIDSKRRCYAMNSGNSDGSNTPVFVIMRNNISDDGSAKRGNYRAKAEDFIGPLEGDADAGSGPGSGFMLASNSAAIDAGIEIDRVIQDFAGTLRPVGTAFDMGAFEFGGTSAVNNVKTQPGTIWLRNFPNPFNPSTTIMYELPDDAFINLDIIDISGRRIRTLIHKHQTKGRHEISFDATGFSSGPLFYQLSVNKQKMTGSMLLVK